jgi:hypothetical protein
VIAKIFDIEILPRSLMGLPSLGPRRPAALPNDRETEIIDYQVSYRI